MEYTDIINQLTFQLDSKAASTVFLNGVPGIGKSFLLHKLAEELPKKNPRLKALGPYNVKPNDSIGPMILNDLLSMGYLESLPGIDVSEYLGSTWNWLKPNLQTASRQSFIVLIDLDDVDWDAHDALRVWFSSFRYLEHVWDSGPARFAVVIAGFWDHPGLNTYYEQLSLSFPYTIGQNYFVWEEAPLNTGIELLKSIQVAEPIKVILGKLIHQISGGNPKVMQDIIFELQTEPPSLASLLNATIRAAKSGPAGQALLNAWKKLPTASLKAINELLILRQIPVKSLPPHLERLNVAGILSERVLLNQRYITLRSWFAEVLLRLNALELGIQDQVLPYPEFKELMPSISVLHEEAYLLIHEIENMLRNFLVMHLAIECPPGEPLLRGRCYKDVNIFRKNGNANKVEQDAQDRAEQWRSRSEEFGLPVHLNPTIAYLSLSDLSDILQELGEIKDSPSWLRVSAAVERVVHIRDAVMHNQIVEIADLEKIYNLQTEIFSALGELSTIFSPNN